LWSIATLIIGILKSVPGAGVDFYVGGFVESLHDLFKSADFGGRNSTVESAEISKHLSVDFLNVKRVRGQRAVIHDTSG